MITVNNPEEILPAYSKWLQINPSIWWALASQDKAFIQKHVSSTESLKCYMHNGMDCYTVPTSVTYPLSKLNAGVVLTKNTWEVLARNIQPHLQDFLLNYIQKKFPTANVSKGLKHNSNDLYINGKKVFGELAFTRARQNYYACMINTYFSEEDQRALQRGLGDDKNFSMDKLRHISGIKNEIPGLDIPTLLEELEEYLFNLAKVPEYIKY